MSESSENPYRSPTSTEPGDLWFDRPIFLSGSLRISDALSAVRLSRRFFWLRTAFWTACAVAFIGLLAVVGIDSLEQAPQAALAILLVDVLLFSICVGSVILAVTRLKKFASLQQGWFAPSESVFVPEGISISRPEGPQAFTWDHFRSYRANHRVALLYTAKTKGYLVVARSKLREPNNWEPLLALIAAKLPRS